MRPRYDMRGRWLVGWALAWAATGCVGDMGPGTATEAPGDDDHAFGVTVGGPHGETTTGSGPSSGSGAGSPAGGSEGGSSASGAGAAGGGGNGASGGNGSSGGSTGSAGGGQGGGGASSPGPCPSGVICVDTFPYAHSGSTTNAASDQFDSYGCGPQNASGPEVIYRIDVPDDGFAWLDLSNVPSGVDVDVHLLGSLNPNDCIDRGHWDAGSLLAPGRYFVTVDTWVDGNGNEYDGPYGLRIGLTTVQDLQSWGMNASVAYDALHAFDEAWRRDEVDTTGYAVVDFNLHASQRRMWVFDVFDASLAYHTHTTVGEMSDPNIDGWATAFSNTSGSHQSSLGMMKGGELYSGNFGASMRLDGLEPGYNTNVRSRAIVMHPWNGSAPAYVAQNPGVGAYPTWGCLGMDPALANPIRQFLSGGGLVLSHFVDGNWSVNSSYLP